MGIPLAIPITKETKMKETNALNLPKTINENRSMIPQMTIKSGMNIYFFNKNLNLMNLSSKLKF
tara:strand:+ start:2126 stop:2317 length:192 start_codon:yes stop_codon:yes gene_type:complete